MELIFEFIKYFQKMSTCIKMFFKFNFKLVDIFENVDLHKNVF
ncbi:unnamed protein product [Chironomus riparius]|uniref:Uncharacterized protein n=1 Tax=Chironomus riparius TaxID=315576 RepID=A0A9N9RRL6_9DIPT|nr:unnamed protein product [Chironomus riparius]